jgi:hypothetical protein
VEGDEALPRAVGRAVVDADDLLLIGVAWTRSRMVSIVFSSLYTGISTDRVTVAGSSGVSSRGFAASVNVRGAGRSRSWCVHGEDAAAVDVLAKAQPGG